MSQMPPDPSNPYSSHGYTPAGYTPGAGPQHPLVGQFKIIGIIFIVLSIIGFFGALVTSLGNVMQIVQGGPKPPPGMDPAGVNGFYFGFYASLIGVGISVLFQPLMLWAGINMIRMKGRGIIMAGAIVACIPMLTSCCFLGIPFGIWALVILFRPETKTLIG